MDDNVPTAELVHEEYVEPKTSIVRTFGILNIVFSLLIGCMCLYALAVAVFTPYISESLDEVREKAKQAQEEQLAGLDEQIENAETEEEKDQIRAQRQRVATRTQSPVVDPFAAMRNPTVITYTLIDGGTGLFFNSLMLASGIGLLYRREWARKLALWVAGLKIIRLVILQLINIIYIVPIQVEGFKQMFDQMQQNAPGPNQVPFDMASMQGIFISVGAVFTILAGSIYPALTLWFLSRPGAKVVCSPDYEETFNE